MRFLATVFPAACRPAVLRRTAAALPVARQQGRGDRRRSLGVLAALPGEMGSVFGKRDVEEPKHETLFTAAELPSQFEVRRYPARWAIATPNDGNKAFMRLAGYIGVGSKPKNSGAAAIAMTAPVVTAPSKPKGTAIAMTAPVVNTGNDMMFILPSDFGPDSVPPAPLDERVRVELLEPEHVVVTTFNGNLNRQPESDPRALARRDALVADAVELGLMPKDIDADKLTMQVYRYNPPWCLGYYKTNEVAIPLTAEQVNAFVASQEDE